MKPLRNQEALAEAKALGEMKSLPLEDARAKADPEAAQEERERAPVQQVSGKRKAVAVINRR